MSAETDAYEEFIDGLAIYRGSATYIRDAFLEKRWNHPSSHLLDNLPAEVREAIASVIEKAAETAMHDVLVYLTDQKYELRRAGVSLPNRRFDNALYEDFIVRRDGLPWPEETA